MIQPTRGRATRRLAVGLAILLLTDVAVVQAQGLVQGVQQGARKGNQAAGPIGGVLGGAIGGVVGAVGGVLGVPANNNSVRGPAQPGARQSKAAKAKGKKAAPAPEPELTAEQVVANSDANIARIKTALNLTPEQEKHWPGFNSAMHYLGNNGADRLKLRIARAQRDPPDDIIEQMRNEAQFLNDRAVDQRNVADAAEPLFASLDARQKALFIEEMGRLSRERGLD
ncbi:MAG: Spy/CpxP family protein refolding chaperone [Tardiphaga sp.]